jgi:hypothetical protein
MLPGLDLLSVPTAALADVRPLHAVWAYIGLGPGQELIPYFFALLAFVGAALSAVLLWPITALLRWFRRGKGGREEPSVTAGVPESLGEGKPDQL